MVPTSHVRSPHVTPDMGLRNLLSARSVSPSSMGQMALATLAINILSLALPLMTLQVYDRILAQVNLGTFAVLIAGVSTVIILEIVLRLARAHMISWTGSAFEHRMTCTALRHVMSVEPAKLGEHDPSDHLQRFNAIGRLREFIGGQALIILIDLPFVAIFLGLVAYLAGPLVYYPLGLLILFATLAWFLGLYMKRVLARREAASDRRVGFIIETLGGIHTVKSLGLEALFCRRHEHVQSELSETVYEAAIIGAAATILATLFSQFMMVMVTAAGAPMVIGGELTIGTLAACVLLSGRVIQPLQKALGIWTRMQDVRLAKVQVGKIFDIPSYATSDETDLAKREGRLDLSGVSFRHHSDGPDVLRDVTLPLSPGSRICISGRMGTGRSTLLQIMAGLLRPTVGTVNVDGIRLDEIPPEKLAQHIGYIPSHGVIFQGTILENLTSFGTVSEDVAREICTLLGIDESIAKLPDGYETLLNGGAAESIPPGLQQLISIGRVLAHKPRILLFDSADKGLDKEGYNQLFRLLGRLKDRVTMVIVSEDKNFLRLGTDEYEIVAGELVLNDLSFDSKIHDVAPYRELRL